MLGLGFGFYCFDTAEQASEAPGDGATASKSEGAKTARPDERSLSVDGGAALRIETALEKGSLESALEGLRELVLARDRNQAEMIDLIRRIGMTPALEQDPRFQELDGISRELDGRINIAQATMLQHDVDPEAIRAIMKEHRERAGRITAIRELSDDLGPPPARR